MQFEITKREGDSQTMDPTAAVICCNTVEPAAILNFQTMDPVALGICHSMVEALAIHSLSVAALISPGPVIPVDRSLCITDAINQVTSPAIV
jgi:hypothetical protein